MPTEKCTICQGTPAENAIDWIYLPFPSFGNPADPTVKVATIGLNPAANEPRLAKLVDYRKSSREELTVRDVENCRARRASYFCNSDVWHNYFKSFDGLLGRVNHLWSYATNAVHIDWVACPTKNRFGETGEKSGAALMTNCRQHFVKTLKLLSEGTLLLLDGKRVCDEMFGAGSVQFDGSPELVLIEPKTIGLRGSLAVGGRQFDFRGWNMRVGRLSHKQGMDLAIWLRGSLQSVQHAGLHSL